MNRFRGEFVSTGTNDGIELQGLMAEPGEDAETIVIHFHGMQGNFYENGFVQEMLSELPENQITFLTVEERGSEAVKYFDQEGEMAKIGDAFEDFEESLKDIDAWIQFARDSGYSRILLQGHSLGTMKVARYLDSLTTTLTALYSYLHPTCTAWELKTSRTEMN